jgi:hypothetical protein
MMGRTERDQASFFYEFRLDDMVPKDHLLRRINVFVTSALGDLHEQLRPFYSDIGRPSIDPELLIRILIVGYCYGIRSERKLCEEIRLHLASRATNSISPQSCRTSKRSRSAPSVRYQVDGAHRSPEVHLRSASKSATKSAATKMAAKNKIALFRQHRPQADIADRNPVDGRPFVRSLSTPQ